MIILSAFTLFLGLIAGCVGLLGIPGLAHVVPASFAVSLISFMLTPVCRGRS